MEFQNFLALGSGMRVDENLVAELIGNGVCELNRQGEVNISATGRALLEAMNLTPKPMKRFKIRGDGASELIDQMFSELN
jgi:hypothetical protein